MPTSKRRVLVLGGWGWLGRAVLRQLHQRGWKIHAPTRREVDITRRDALARILESVEPSHVLNLTAAQPGASPKRLRAVNEVAPRVLAELLVQRSGTRLVHMSSDMVHDGRSAPYTEDAPMAPLTPYGQSKAAGEAAIRSLLPDALCVRTSLIVDDRFADRATREFADRLSRGEEVALYTDEIRSPQTRGVLARALIDLLQLDVGGVLNVAGRDAVSRHELTSLLFDRFQVPRRNEVRTVERAALEARGAAPRPRDLTLDVSRAERVLGRILPGVRTTLSR